MLFDFISDEISREEVFAAPDLNGSNEKKREAAQRRAEEVLLEWVDRFDVLLEAESRRQTHDEDAFGDG